MHHMPKSLTKSLVHEASILFAHELTLALTRGFRESKRGLAHMEMACLVTHLRVERWREALLWSWVVGRVGGADGVWGEEARQEVRKVLGRVDGVDGVKVLVEKDNRTPLEDMIGLTERAGWEAPQRSQYLFCESFRQPSSSLTFLSLV